MNKKISLTAPFERVGCKAFSLRWSWAVISTVLLGLSLGWSQADDLSQGRLLICNQGDRTLSIVDPALNKQIAAVPEEGQTGHEVLASSDGRLAFVPIYGSSGVGKPGTDGRLLRVIDLDKQAIIGTIDFGKGVRPHCARIGPKNGLLYITTELDNTVTIIDPATLKIIGSVPTGQPESHMLIISSNGRLGYTANVAPGSVSVLDLVNNKVLKVIPASPVIQRIAISTDDKWVFTADQTKPQLVVIDTTRNEVSRRLDLPAVAYGSVTTPDGRWLLLTLMKPSELAVLDLQTMTIARTIKVPPNPEEILVRPDGRVAYVSCGASRQVAVIDLKEWKVTALIDAGKGADGLAWAQRK